MKNVRNQQGVALLFALGMLTILLITGMAFVANSLTAQKVAANNSARTQSRMFAQSAISRVLASIMLFQHRTLNSNSMIPEKFDSVYSYSGASGMQDGLTGDNSLLRLPTDSTVVAENIAREFNRRFESGWQGTWVNFYDSTNTSDRQIIGRAAWQVLSISPQILAPVFLSGHLDTDGSPGWKPNVHRWGREIDEVNITNSPAFNGALGGEKTVTGSTVIKDFSANLYPVLEDGWTGTDYSDKDKVKRWIEKWLMPDVRGGTVLEPTPIIPEVYSAMDGSRKRQYLRFNISEILRDNLPEYGSGITTSSDPWYARFGINSTAAAVAGNNQDALDKLTANSPEAAIGDSYDYKLALDERPSLPFLRRIGNFAEDQSTFTNVETWRKQIAANFNDYCDADSVPTSDKLAKDWMTLTGDEHPNFTGNEKTPYLYEIGFRLGFYPELNSKADVSKSGISVKTGQAADEGGNKYSTTVTAAYAGIAPIVKLANIYNFDPAGFSDFKAGVELGKFEVKFKPSVITLKINYLDENSVAQHKTLDKKKTKDDTYDMAFNELTATVADNTMPVRTLAVTDNTILNNTAGANPYPLLLPADTIQENETVKLTLDSDKLTFDGTKDIFNQAGAGLQDTDTITGVEVVSVDAVEVTGVKLNVKRAYLAATVNSSNIGLDYMKTLPELTWTVPDDKDTKIEAQTDTNKTPGIYIGGIRNYDPRQNLNPDDWFKILDLAKADNIRKPAEDSKLDEVMNVGAVPADNTAARQGVANHVDDNASPEYAKFRPVNSDDTQKMDFEVAEEPGWRDAAAGTDNTKHLSTAFIRNAPMMSPWEIGFIHRGVRWQTLNIKRACDPGNNSEPITLAGHAPSGNWSSGGTSYLGGDGAILDQIKMTDQCATYGKINVNKLRSNDPDHDSTYDKEIIRVLFDQLCYNQPVQNFYDNSKRDGGQNLPNADDGGTRLNYADISNRIITGRNANASRAQFLEWSKENCDLSNAFGGAFSGGDGATDAAQEEIIGKTINLLCAESVAPTQIYAVIVAQSIRDVGGYQSRGNDEKKDCAFGTFDFDSANNIYYDEITGEVKMFVTIDRDINTGRMTVRRIDYLE